MRPRSSDRSRRRFPVRPVLEGLEVRSLMAVAGGLDPSFGKGSGVFLDPVKLGTPNGSGLNNLDLVKVEADDSIVAAGPAGTGTGGMTFGVIHLKADGTLDPAFGKKGEADVALPSGVGGTDFPASLLVQPDGKIVLIGQVSTGGTVVARFTANGASDPSFGANGVAIVSIPNADTIYGALQSDGKIVLTEPTFLSSASLSGFAVTTVRLDPNGTLDPSFGNKGVATISDVATGTQPNSNAPVERIEGMAIQPSGRIVILANINTSYSLASPSTPELIRLNADGSRDTSLSQSGITASGIATPGRLIVQPDGKLLVLGQAAKNNAPILVRLNADGSLDGTATTLGPSVIPTRIALQPDGKVVLQGTNKAEVFRFTANLTPDATFGQGGHEWLTIPLPPNANGSPQNPAGVSDLTVGPDNRIVLVGANAYDTGFLGFPATELVVARLKAWGSAHPGDFTGDGLADPAVYLPSLGAFAIRSSSGGPDHILPFGIPGAGQTIPAPGNYTGSGQEEIGAYLPSLGEFAYRPANGGPDVLIPFGIAGKGQTIPASGDYFGTDQDDIAAYLPALGEFAIRNPSTGVTSILPFGIKGTGQSIPVPGDYDGSGKTELAVYLPSLGAFAYRPANGGADVIVKFGIPGAGQTIPTPGDYDGSGKTELAVYLPSLAEFIYRSAIGKGDVAVPFGKTGAGQTIPAPGDYTGSGQTEVGAYLPSLGDFAYRPTHGSDVAESFGIPGAGQSIPVTVGSVTPDPDLFDFVPATKQKAGQS